MDTAPPEGPELTEANLRLLISGKAVSAIRVVGGIKGYVIEAHYGAARSVLANTRRSERRFASIDAAAALLKRIGAPRFEVDVTDFKHGLVRKPRPDRARPKTGSADSATIVAVGNKQAKKTSSRVPKRKAPQ